MPDEPVGKYGRPQFQAMSYHDTPERSLPEMRYVDPTPGPGKSPEYRVLTVNGVGLPSEPSCAAQVP